MIKKILLYIILTKLLFSSFIIAAPYNPEEQFGIGVNRFIWYGSLQSINFMPLLSADFSNGVIITDWYSPNNGLERYKITIYILNKYLTPNSVKVKLFKQKKQNGAWLDEKVNSSLETKIEDSILTIARTIYYKETLSN